MDENKRFVIEKRIAKTMANLEKNNMQPFYAKTKEDALKIVESLIPTGQVVACGGSVTLAECGIMDLLRSGRYDFLDRAKPGLTPQESKDILRKAFLQILICSVPMLSLKMVSFTMWTEIPTV